MKNKLKKSKIIVPALALITVTTAASVTGTVAWFTAARTATVTASVFESKSLDSSMTVKTTALVGTKDGTASGATLTDTGSISVNGKITHGSYNAEKSASGNLYVARVNADDPTNPIVESYDSYGTESDAETNGTAPTSKKLSTWLASVDDENQSNNVWYAVAWSMEFTVTNTSTLAENSALFFDPSSTTFTDAQKDVTGTKTIQGLRIALMTSENYVVVGGLATSGSETEKHVMNVGTITYTTDNDGKTTSNAADFVESFNTKNETHYFKYGDALAKASDATADTLEKHNGYLGTFDTSTNKVTVTAVAWFEGEDSSIVKDNVMSKVTASLKFYSRNIKTA